VPGAGRRNFCLGVGFGEGGRGGGFCKEVLVLFLSSQKKTSIPNFPHSRKFQHIFFHAKPDRINPRNPPLPRLNFPIVPMGKGCPGGGEGPAE